MAPTSNISVLVLEGNYSVLHGLGFPISALAAMQEAGVHIREACWDVKQSNTGLSVSFFWPHCSPTVKLSKPSIAHKTVNSNNYSKSKRRRLRGNSQLKCSVEKGVDRTVQSRATIVAHPYLDGASVSVAGLAPKSPGFQPESDDDPHLACTESTSMYTFEGFEDQPPSVSVDLSDAVINVSSSVLYKELDDSPTPEVRVEQVDGTSTWSPIIVSKRLVKPASSDTSDDDLSFDKR